MKRGERDRVFVCMRLPASSTHSQINAFERITHTPCEPQTEPQNMRRPCLLHPPPPLGHPARHGTLYLIGAAKNNLITQTAREEMGRERGEARRVINCWTSKEYTPQSTPSPLGNNSYKFRFLGNFACLKNFIKCEKTRRKMKKLQD